MTDDGKNGLSVTALIIVAIGILAMAVTLWKLILCPGNLGYFDNFLCNCKTGASKPNVYGRCLCNTDMVEFKNQCVFCGGNTSAQEDLQPPCSDGTCKANFIKHNGMCHFISFLE